MSEAEIRGRRPNLPMRRLLTGADFDPEDVSARQGQHPLDRREFGPFLLQTDLSGKVLRAPIPLPGVSSPDITCSPGAQSSSQ